MTRPRVVVTGLGVVSCLGSGVKHFWRRLVNGDCGVSALRSPELSWFPSRVGGVIPMGDEPGQLSVSEFDTAIIRQRGLASMYALIAAQEALKDAEWLPNSADALGYTGVSIGRVSADTDAIGQAHSIVATEQSIRRVNPYTAARSCCNISAFTVGEKFGFSGPQLTSATACAAGGQALIDGYKSIILHDAKVMVCGGADAVLVPVMMGGFCKAKALSTNYNHSPELASRPFDADRDGFVLSDGAAVVVLEDLDHALARNAAIYAEMLGYGLCRDLGTVTAPDEAGRGVSNCMNRAMLNARLEAQDVSYVNAHATSTPAGDAAEARGIIQCFGMDSVYVASNKGSLGHMQGAAGAAEFLSCVLSCRDALIPPTVNLIRPEVEGVKYVMGKHVEWARERRVALSNSLGFGSNCASIVLSNYIP